MSEIPKDRGYDLVNIQHINQIDRDYALKLYDELIKRTNFLQYDAQDSERVYVLINDITEQMKCPYCSNKLAFHKMNLGYYSTCQSKECVTKHRIVTNKESTKKINWNESLQKQKATCLERYGAEHNWCNGTTSRESYYKTMEETYGSRSPLQVHAIKQRQESTTLSRHGRIGFLHSPKMLATLIERFPDAYNDITKRANVMTSKKGHDIWETAVMAHYGVNNPMQVKEIFEKQQKNGFVLKEYKESGVFYRGTFEYDFLCEFFNTITIEDPAITPTYQENGIDKKYFPDFYIPSKNLIVEIKSSYYFNRDREQIISKAIAVMKLGYEFMIIIDKEYKYFKKYCGI
jgi:hypothetical protein